MLPEEKLGISLSRYLHAKECFNEAEMLLQNGSYKGAANRSYYAVFHSMRSVLALDGIDRKKHSAVISEFRRLYIKENIFDESLSGIAGDSFTVRQLSDYDDFFIISKEDVTIQVCDARLFLSEVGKYLDKQCLSISNCSLAQLLSKLQSSIKKEKSIRRGETEL